MVHQLIESYKHIASEGNHADTFNVKTDRGLIFTLEKDPITKKITCNCPFSILNKMICSHAFTLMNALQIKHLGYCGNSIQFWRDEVNTEDPSCQDILPKNQQAKKMRSFVDKLADKTRLRRARHKGGYVPSKLKKVHVEFFDSDNEGDNHNDD